MASIELILSYMYVFSTSGVIFEAYSRLCNTVLLVHIYVLNIEQLAHRYLLACRYRNIGVADTQSVAIFGEMK